MASYRNRCPRRKVTKRQEAEKRNAHWAALAPREQLAELDRRREPTMRQRKRIRQRMEKAAAA